MRNILKIRWTEEATNNLESIILYLEANWSEQELTTFFTKLEKQLELLSIFPQAYPVSLKRKEVHRSVFMKNLTNYYTADNGFIVLLSIFDTRQQLKRLKI
jgi:plasmid stabilization system protein ParE